MKAKFKHKQEQRFGAIGSFNQITLHVFNETKEDVDIVSTSGGFEHGFKCEHLETINVSIEHFEDVSSIINKLEFLIDSLKVLEDL